MYKVYVVEKGDLTFGVCSWDQSRALSKLPSKPWSSPSFIVHHVITLSLEPLRNNLDTLYVKRDNGSWNPAKLHLVVSND